MLVMRAVRRPAVRHVEVLDEAVLFPNGELPGVILVALVEPVLVTRVEAQVAAARERRAHERVQLQDGPVRDEAMLVPRNARERVHGHGAVGHREPVHLDGLADTGRFAELLGQAARGVGRDRRDLFSVFGRVLRDGVLEDAERRAHRNAVHLEIAFERGLFDFVVGLCRVVGQIPVQRLVALRRVAHDALRGRINQRRPVRARGKELLVV